MEMIAQIFGMTLVCVILLCLIWTVVSYVFSISKPRGNKRLLENMETFDKNKKYEIN